MGDHLPNLIYLSYKSITDSKSCSFLIFGDCFLIYAFDINFQIMDLQSLCILMEVIIKNGFI